MLEIISSDQAKALGPYSQAIKVGNLLFTAGQIGINPHTEQLISEDVGEQTQQALQNLEVILLAAGVTPNNVVKCTCFLTDMADYPKFNAAYTDFFKGHKPARSTVAVKQLPRNSLVEIECIASI